jgi:hypothetical protein
MVDLYDYLMLNSNAIVDLVNKKYVPTEMTEDSALEELAGVLMGMFVLGDGRELGKRDQAHDVLAMTIIYSMWCGWFSRAVTKVNSGKYTEESANRFKKLIVDAYEIGQNYSEDQPYF